MATRLRTALLSSVLALGIPVFATACSSSAEPVGSDSAATSIDPNQAAGGLIGALCTDTTGNPLGKFIVNAAGGGLPDSDKAAAALCNESKGRPTAECRDYCEARNPGTVTAAIADVLSYSAFNTYIPARYWSQIVNTLTGSSTTATEAGVVQCATLVGWAAAEFYYAAKGCERGSQCMTCDETSTSIRNGCLIGQTVLWCAQAIGFTAPPAVSQISAACTVGRLCSKGVLMEGCRRSCAASLPAAAPIAQPVTTDQGTTRRCCTCERSTWEDRPLITGGDDLLSSEYYYSPVSDYDGDVSECEGKEHTTSEIAGGRGPHGDPTYYYYTNCRKATFDGAVCPQGNGYHAPSKGSGQMIKSRQDAGQCLTHQGEGANVIVSPCDSSNANQRWAIEQKARSGSETTIVIRPQTDGNLCLDMNQTELVDDNGYRAYLFGCHGGNNQQFVHTGAAELLQRYTLNNYCLDWWFTNGSTVHMPTCHSSGSLGLGSAGPNQQWDIVDP
jgi:hypothetical protein